jgi:hypothetical protein
VTIQDIENFKCAYCGNSDIAKFTNYTHKEDTYEHLKCEVCYAELTCFKDSGKK